jgi:ribonuclease P protein component
VTKVRREGFPRHQRIVRGSDYRLIYGGGLKFNSESLVLFARPSNLDYPRLGITVSRKIGGAVVRNRVKRVFREVFRRSCADLPNHFDFVVNAKRPSANAAYSQLRAEFLHAVRHICR